MKLRIRFRRVLLFGSMFAIALWLGGSAYVTRLLTRRPHPIYQESAPASLLPLHFETERLQTVDGQQIGAWLVRGEPKRPCLLLMHGISASRAQMLRVMEMAAQEHCTVLAISLRAHGDSTGDTNDVGWSARHDAVAGVEFLERHFPGRPIFLVGRSQGAATAVFAAKELGNRVAGYFLEQPYRDLDRAVWYRLRHFLPPVLDYAAYAGLQLWAPAFLDTPVAEISPEKHITDIPEQTPIVFITGGADRHAPLSDVQAMFDHVRTHAKLIVVKDAVHEALDERDPELYRHSLFELLRL